MNNLTIRHTFFAEAAEQWQFPVKNSNKKAVLLLEANESEVLNFLKVRPVHTVVMTSFIKDNGMESANNRGKFYGCRNPAGGLEGVALIGHTTLIEARSEQTLAEFARVARRSETPIHFMMSDGSTIENFWKHFVKDSRAPRRVCTEKLYKIERPVIVRKPVPGLGLATQEHLLQVAEAHAEVAFQESGVNPLEKDREGFLKRVSRRIELGRVWTVTDENGKLIFKADVVAETSEVNYLEGIWVAPDHRGENIGTNCLSQLSRILLNSVKFVCLLSNESFVQAHRAYLKAGFKSKDCCVTIFA